jgi:hypothetical protein
VVHPIQKFQSKTRYLQDRRRGCEMTSLISPFGLRSFGPIRTSIWGRANGMFEIINEGTTSEVIFLEECNRFLTGHRMKQEITLRSLHCARRSKSRKTAQLKK